MTDLAKQLIDDLSKTPGDDVTYSAFCDYFQDHEPTVVFVAIKSGVYRHEILGVCKSLAKAVQAGCNYINSERDKYHAVDICLVEIDNIYEQLDPEVPLFQLQWRPDHPSHSRGRGPGKIHRE